MFVRINRLGEGYSGVYECSRTFVNESILDNGKKNDELAEVVIESNDPGGSVSVVVEKASAEVYIMNNDGHTIDTYRWHGYKKMKKTG